MFLTYLFSMCIVTKHAAEPPQIAKEINHFVEQSSSALRGEIQQNVAITGMCLVQNKNVIK